MAEMFVRIARVMYTTRTVIPRRIGRSRVDSSKLLALPLRTLLMPRERLPHYPLDGRKPRHRSSMGPSTAVVVNRTHHADIGCATPGGMPVATRLEDEGLVIARSGCATGSWRAGTQQP